MTQKGDTEKLRSLAENVRGSYPDFVNGVVSKSEKSGVTSAMIAFIEENDVSDEDVLLRLFEITLLGRG